jgi:putative endonuclease
MNPFERLQSKRIGQNKEQLAARWLKQQGFEIVAQNHHCQGGEIDLIGFHSARQQLVFFEVKYRKSTRYGHPAECVSPQQQQRIVRCAQHFLLQHSRYQNCQLQFDLLSFVNDQPEPERIENAFSSGF